MPKAPEAPDASDDEAGKPAAASDEPDAAAGDAPAARSSTRPAKAAAQPPEKPSAAGASEDEDDDDGSDDDEDEEDEEDEEPEAPPPRKRAAAARVRPPPPPPPEDENALDSPTRQTLGMLIVVGAATLLMWFSAKAACNYHPPETRKPRAVPIAELAKEPKGAAIEMQQRWATFDFAGALEVAKGTLAEDLKRARAACEANQSDCDRKRAQFDDDKVATVGELLSRDGTTAGVRVTVHGGEGGTQSWLVTVEKEGSIWKAVSRGEAPPPAPRPRPPPASSAATAPSAEPVPSAAPPSSVAPAPSAARPSPAPGKVR